MTITNSNAGDLSEQSAALDTETLDLAVQLIRAESISPLDAGCQKLMADYLSDLGFEIEHLRFEDVDNIWAVRKGTNPSSPLFAFAGHTDVVPTGPVQSWHHEPFSGKVVDGVLHGRGAADMKGSLAAMLTATKSFLSETPEPEGSIGFLITSDEEDKAINGTRKVMELLQSRGTIIDWCLVGEPSSSAQLGDVIRTGRRGSLNAKLRINGIQGHVAYPQTADNPIHKISPALDDLAKEHWDDGNSFFPATTFQISNINAGTGATNVIPGEAKVVFNFRFSTEITEDEIKNRTEKILQKNHVDYEIKWILSGKPFITGEGELINAAKESIFEVAGLKTKLSTAGGTSDGRFIAPYGSQVLELGPVNATIHKVDECANIKELDCLSYIYQRVLEKLLV